MAGNFIAPQSRASVPNGYLRDSYDEWIDDFKKVEALLEKKKDNARMREQVRAAPRALSDVKEKDLKSLENQIALKAKTRQDFYRKNARHPDSFSQLIFEYPDSLLRASLEDFQENFDADFEELAEVWPEDALTDAERAKQLNALGREDAKIDKEISKYKDFPKWREHVEHLRF